MVVRGSLVVATTVCQDRWMMESPCQCAVVWSRWMPALYGKDQLGLGQQVEVLSRLVLVGLGRSIQALWQRVKDSWGELCLV
ncbi:hypothetical protein DYB37_012467 [Aphanomyces astaci]|uniref:Uncharacterized protein n=1 Tax=Aphanomyces astaci TaxID=112090 RepID=A0A418E8B8_APHAT|nr:hypothetical protein DYB37_012467 [Aphanomyces astaci]